MSMGAVHECMTTVLVKILPLYNTSSADTVEEVVHFYAAAQGRSVGAFSITLGKQFIVLFVEFLLFI